MKVKEIMKRQSELAEKIAKGEADDNDYAELKRLNDMIAEAQIKAEEPKEKLETELAVLTADEFVKYCEASQVSDDERVLGLLMQNIERVEAQKAKGQEAFAVEVPVQKQAPEELTILDVLAAIADLKDSLAKAYTTDGRTSSGLREDAEEETEEEQSEAEKAEVFDVEAIGKWIGVVQELSGKITKAELELAEVQKAFGGEEVKDYLERALDVMQKMSDCVEALGVIANALQVMDKAESEETSQPEEAAVEETTSEEAEGTASLEEEAEEGEAEEAGAEQSEQASEESEGEASDQADESGVAKVDWDGDLAGGMKFSSIEEEYAYFKKANNR